MSHAHTSRVLLVTRNLPPLVGGMERLNWHLAQELARAAEVRSVGPAGSAAVAPAGVAVREAPLKPLWKFLWRAYVLAQREARAWRPDWVLAGSGLTAPIALRAARACGARTAVYAHGLDVALRNPVYRALWLPAIRRMDRVIANSRATADLCRGIGVDPARLGIVHPGVDLPRNDIPLEPPSQVNGEGPAVMDPLSDREKGSAAHNESEPLSARKKGSAADNESGPLSPWKKGSAAGNESEPLSAREKGSAEGKESEPLSPWERGRGEGANTRAAPSGVTRPSPAANLPEHAPTSTDSSFRGRARPGRERNPESVSGVDACASVRGDDGSAAPDARTRRNLADGPILLSVGRLSARKGLREFVAQCLPRIVKVHPDVTLLIVGEAPKDALHAAAQTPESIRGAAVEAGVGSSLEFLGKLPDDELDAAYRAADVHVFPVREVPGDIEGFGMVAVEAAAHGLPTVAFATGGVIDAVAEGESGHLVPPGDYAAFAAAVLRVLAGDAALRAGSAQFARRFAWSEFGLEVRAQLSEATSAAAVREAAT